MDVLFDPLTYISLIILMFSAILHEIAHGYVADRLGDPTARILGRLTLDPRPHIDPIMTVLLPLLLYILSHGTFVFGGAKPVPVDPYNLQDGRKDLALVSLAGPGTNILLAVIFALLIHVLFPQSGPHFPSLPEGILLQVVHVNVILAIFNLLPIPPLDGSKLFALLLPERDARAYLSLGNIGLFLLIFLLQVPVGPFSLQELLFRLYTTFLKFLGF